MHTRSQNHAAVFNQIWMSVSASAALTDIQICFIQTSSMLPYDIHLVRLVGDFVDLNCLNERSRGSCEFRETFGIGPTLGTLLEIL